MLKTKLSAGAGAVAAALVSPVASAHHHIDILGMTVPVASAKLVFTVLVTAALMLSVWRLRRVPATQRGDRR